MILPAEVEELIASLKLPDFGASGGGCRTSSSIGSGQFEQFEAALERRVAQEAAGGGQPSRPLWQAERGPERPSGRHVAASRRSRFRGSARGVCMRPLRLASRSEVGQGNREAPGVRSSRASAPGHGTSGFDLSLRTMPGRDEGRVSRWRGLADPIWRAYQGGGDLSQHPSTHPRGSGRAGAERSVRANGAASP